MTPPIVVGLALREDDAAPLALAVELAELGDLPLALVTSYPRESRAALASPEYATALRQAAHQEIEAVAETLRPTREVECFVRQGSPAQALHDVAEHYGGAAIVVGSTHRGPVGRVLAGDIAAGVLHGAPCPVAVAPRGYIRPTEGVRRIGVAFTDTVEGREALAGAARLTAACGGSLHSFTVAEPRGWTGAAAVPGWAPPFEVVETARAHARHTADAALAALPPDLPATAAVLEGQPVPALAQASAPLDLLVCGSRGYGALRSVVAGGVSRGLAHAAECPLLVVPRGPAKDSPLVRGHEAHAVAPA
jgi:nucleotide-binding universal stress UspA family protein